MILKAQEVWLNLGKCFEEPAREWFFTASPMCAFDHLGHPISGWKIKQCRNRIVQLINCAKQLGTQVNGTSVPGNDDGRTRNFQTIVDYYQRLLERFLQLPPTLRRNMKSSARSLNNGKLDSRESSQTLPPSRSIDVYPFELDNGRTTHIIHADPQYADAALEQPLLIPKPTPQLPHCFVIIHNKGQHINPPDARSSSSSQYSEQQEQQLEEVLQQPHPRGKQQSVHQAPSTSKVRDYVSQPRNSGSIFIDRINSFGDIRDHPRSPDPRNSNDRQSRNSNYSSELGVERELRIKKQRGAHHISTIPMPNFDQNPIQPEMEREETPAQEYVEQVSNEP